MQQNIAAFTALIALVLLSSGCVTSPYRRCNVDRSEWKYVPLQAVDIEVRRLVTSRSMSELLRGESEQLWFRGEDGALMVCRQSRHAKEMCFSDFEFFAQRDGTWVKSGDDEILCTR